jgi:hypothetical protein
MTDEGRPLRLDEGRFKIEDWLKANWLIDFENRYRAQRKKIKAYAFIFTLRLAPCALCR